MKSVTKNMEQLKNQWKREMWLKLYDNFKGCEYHGYNNIKPLFDDDVLEFKLSEKITIELKVDGLIQPLQYCDFWLLTGDYDINKLNNRYTDIWDTNKFEQLRKFVIDTYNDLIDFTSKLLYDFSIYDEPVNNDMIKDYINNYLNEKLN